MARVPSYFGLLAAQQPRQSTALDDISIELILPSARLFSIRAAVRRERPWYKGDGRVTFSAMLGKLRLAIWDRSISAETGDASVASVLLSARLS